MKNKILGRKIAHIIVCLIFWGITFIITIPLLWGFLLSFKDNASLYNDLLALPSKWNFDNYIRSFNTINLGQLYLNTFLVMIVSVGIAIVFTFMSSCAISHLTNKNRVLKHLYTYLLLGLMVPPFILLFPVYRIGVLLKIHQSRWPLILAYIATNISFDTLLLILCFLLIFLKVFPMKLKRLH